MKITDVECLVVWAAERGINLTLVVVDTDEGVSGVGEPGLIGNEPAVVGAVERFKPGLIGRDLVAPDVFRMRLAWEAGAILPPAAAVPADRQGALPAAGRVVRQLVGRASPVAGRHPATAAGMLCGPPKTPSGS